MVALAPSLSLCVGCDGGGVRRRRAVGAAVAPAPFLFQKYLCRELLWPLDAHTERGTHNSLRRGLRRLQPTESASPRVGTTVSKQSFAERMAALGEGSQSGSGCGFNLLRSIGLDRFGTKVIV
jgi:hypothetical protein